MTTRLNDIPQNHCISYLQPLKCLPPFHVIVPLTVLINTTYLDLLNRTLCKFLSESVLSKQLFFSISKKRLLPFTLAFNFQLTKASKKLLEMLKGPDLVWGHRNICQTLRREKFSSYPETNHKVFHICRQSNLWSLNFFFQFFQSLLPLSFLTIQKKKLQNCLISNTSNKLSFIF